MFKGLQLENHPNLLQKGEYQYAENIVLTELVGSLTNERGTMLISELGENAIVIGQVQMVNNFILFVSRLDTSEIWVLWEDRLLEVNLNGIDFTFNKAYPIQGEYQQTFEEYYRVAFTDNFNKPKAITIKPNHGFVIVFE